MKLWQRTMATIVCSGAILMTSGLGAAPVHANALPSQSQTYAPVVLLQPQHNIPFSVQFTDGVQAKVTNLRTKAVSTFDLSANKTTYLNQGIYQANGKLQKADGRLRAKARGAGAISRRQRQSALDGQAKYLGSKQSGPYCRGNQRVEYRGPKAAVARGNSGKNRCRQLAFAGCFDQ